MPDSNDLVVTMARGIDVIQTLAEHDRSLTLAEIATRIDTSRATSRRLLITLQELGYVRSDGPTFALRPKVMELGDRYLAGLNLPAIAHPYIKKLADSVRETCSLTILDEDSIVYVDRVKASRLMTVHIAVGTRLPAYGLSSGRVLLGELPESETAKRLTRMRAADGVGVPRDIDALIERAREDGYAATDQELDPALRSIAAAIKGPDGHAVAAVNVSTAVSRTSMEQLRKFVLPELLQATRAIGAALSDG